MPKSQQRRSIYVGLGKVIGKQVRRALRSNSRHGRIFSSATAAFSVVWPRPALFAVVG
jgi:hypothetical protein